MTKDKECDIDDADQSVARVIRNFRRDVIQIFIRLGYNTIQSIYGAVIDQRAVNSRKASYELRLETVPRKKKKKESVVVGVVSYALPSIYTLRHRSEDGRIVNKEATQRPIRIYMYILNK